MAPRWEKQSEIWAQAAYYAGLGFILPAGLVVGYLLGWALDGWFHTRPVLSVILAFAGAAGGFVEILRLLKRAEERANRDNSGGGSGEG